MERRNFISVVGTVAMAAPIVGSTLTACSSESKTFEGHVFPELPYAYNTLEPYIDAQTMELHYDKHHRGYFTKFIAAIDGTDAVMLPVEDIFANIDNYGEAVRNNGGGYYNHKLFWENMSPEKTAIPESLMAAINADFGSVDQLRDEFSNAAKTHFGSGWAWFAVGDDGKLFVTSTANQDNPLMNDAERKGKPLLTIDVWEHAYYLHYQNKRAEYVDNFWNIINWEEVSRRYETI